MEDYKNKSQIKKNILFNILLFGMNAVIGIIIPPFLIKHLGVEVYGVIPIATSVTSFMLLFTISINGALSRFFSIDLYVSEKKVSQTFNTAFFTMVVVVIVLLPVSMIFSFNVEHVLNIPAHVVKESHLLFFLVFMSFFFNTFSSVFNSVAYVKNRIDLRNISVIIEKLVQLILLILLFSFNFIQIQVYGIAVFISTLLACIYSYVVFKRLVPFIKITPEDFSCASFKEMLTLGVWLIVNQIGVLMFLQTEVLIINYIKGPALSGVYAALIQWSLLIRAITGVLSGVTGPLILNLYALKDRNALNELTKFSIKLIGIFTTCIVAVLIYFSSDILYLWLGADFVQYKYVFMWIVFHLGFNLSSSPIANLNIAFNKVCLPGIVTLLTGVSNIILGIVFLKYTDLGLMGVALSGCFFLTLKNFVFTPVYAAKIMKINYFSYYKPIMPTILITVFILFLSYVWPSSRLGMENGYVSLIGSAVLFFLILTVAVYYAFFNRSERSLLLSLIIKRK